MTETFTSGGKSIRMEIHQQASSRPQPAIVLLHGSGGNIGFWLERLAPNITAANVSLFAPHYFDRTGTQRADYAAITDGVHVPQWLDTISTALSIILHRPEIDANRVAFVGISLGAFLSLALAAVNSASSDPAVRARIRCLIDISGGLVEPFATQATTSFPPTLIVHGEADEVVPVNLARELESRLSSLSVPHQTKILPGEGHWFSLGSQMQLMMALVGFLRAHL
jgi:carboxymethylenebutenolidase